MKQWNASGKKLIKVTMAERMWEDRKWQGTIWHAWVMKPTQTSSLSWHVLSLVLPISYLLYKPAFSPSQNSCPHLVYLPHFPHIRSGDGQVLAVRNMSPVYNPSYSKANTGHNSLLTSTSMNSMVSDNANNLNSQFQAQQCLAHSDNLMIVGHS